MAAEAELEEQLARVEARAAAFFDALRDSSTNVPQLGRELLEEVEALDRALGQCGAKGFSLLLGSKEVGNNAIVREKLEALPDTTRIKDDERNLVHSSVDWMLGAISRKR